jgi:hypothetical protein
VQVLSQYVPFQLQNWSALQRLVMLAIVASGTFAYPAQKLRHVAVCGVHVHCGSLVHEVDVL